MNQNRRKQQWDRKELFRNNANRNQSREEDEEDEDEDWINDVTQELALYIITVCEDIHPEGIKIMNNTLYINFESFGYWYNMGGYDELSWIELIDLYKWALDDENPRSGSGNGSAGKNGKVTVEVGTLSPKAHSDDYDEAYSIYTTEMSDQPTNIQYNNNNSEYRPRSDSYTTNTTNTVTVSEENDILSSDYILEEEEEAKGPVDYLSPGFMLNLLTHDYDCVFPVSISTVRSITLFGARTGLSSMDCHTVVRVLYKYANEETQLISKYSYNKAVNELLLLTNTSVCYGNTNSNSSAPSNDTYSNEYNQLFDNLFYSYTRNSDITNVRRNKYVHTSVYKEYIADTVDQVDVLDIISGLVLLCKG